MVKQIHFSEPFYLLYIVILITPYNCGEDYDKVVQAFTKLYVKKLNKKLYAC